MRNIIFQKGGGGGGGGFGPYSPPPGFAPEHDIGGNAADEMSFKASIKENFQLELNKWNVVT